MKRGSLSTEETKPGGLGGQSYLRWQGPLDGPEQKVRLHTFERLLLVVVAISVGTLATLEILRFLGFGDAAVVY